MKITTKEKQFLIRRRKALAHMEDVTECSPAGETVCEAPMDMSEIDPEELAMAKKMVGTYFDMFRGQYQNKFIT